MDELKKGLDKSPDLWYNKGTKGKEITTMPVWELLLAYIEYVDRCEKEGIRPMSEIEFWHEVEEG